MTDTSALFDEPSTRAAVTVEVGPHTARLRGYGLERTLQELHIPHTACSDHWCITVDRVADLLARIEYADRRAVQLTAVVR
ncbi:hypothetical protein FHU33_3911 [Blastococcus colisei]|uniref:Uncharacterized protein n=1 Tax=Blastococcus colisei TaxID=1564162 RepID=A0A543PK14_9ACTN|nr:hypothetical protein [Blastococcus colisei]TQN44409.1 hypothetical protein FHU33_3911 [Blastococcus colisei]